MPIITIKKASFIIIMVLGMYYKIILIIMSFCFMKNHWYYIKIYQIIMFITLQDIDAKIMVIDFNDKDDIAIADVIYICKGVLWFVDWNSVYLLRKWYRSDILYGE